MADRQILAEFEVDGVRCQVVTLRDTAPPVRPLSPREQEIAQMVAEGYTNRSIARVLDISEWTVGTHLRRIYSKLDVQSRAAMVARLFAGDRDGHRKT